MTHASFGAPEDGWVPGELEGSEVEWFRIVDFGLPPRALGILRGREWVLATEETDRTLLYRLVGPALVGVLPVLQRRVTEVEAAARSAIGVDSSGWVLPVDLIYRTAMGSGSAYWVGAAAKWMEHAVPEALSPDELREVVNSGIRLDQSVRHQLLKVARQVERRNSDHERKYGKVEPGG